MTDPAHNGTLLARLQGLFVSPPEKLSSQPAGRDPGSIGYPQSIEVAVVGLSSGCGASTVATGLAIAATHDLRAGNLIDVAGVSRARSLGPVRIWPLPPALTDPDEIREYGGMVARIEGGRGASGVPVATVWDVPAAKAGLLGEALLDVEAVVCVAASDSEPALARIATDMLGERCGRVVLVANCADLGDWDGKADIELPASRFGARMIARGLSPVGAMGSRLFELLGLLEVER